MRHAGSNRRSRNRGGNGNRKGGSNRSQVFDSNGPEVRIRGTAHQICEKYTALAKDATSSGDIVLAESYLQHAEHYQRVINSWVAERDDQPKQNNQKNKAESGPVDGNKKQEDDLGLPASILAAGAEQAAQVAKEHETSQETTLEDA